LDTSVGAAAVSLIGNGYSRTMTFLIAALTGFAEPLGGLLGSTAVSFAASFTPFALAFAAGAMLFITSDEIIPAGAAFRISPHRRCSAGSLS
jgi:ZIP family zinc transporter